VAAADLLIRLAPRARRGHGLLDHFDHLGPRGTAGGEAGASARAGDAPEDRGRAGETRRTAAVVSAESLLSAIFPARPQHACQPFLLFAMRVKAVP
jgi:hypothetical protein